jgi:hypothetical protein
LKEAKESEPHNDHGELTARLEEITKKIIETILIIVNAYSELVIAPEHVKCGFKAFFGHNSGSAVVMESFLHFCQNVGTKLTPFTWAMVLM